MSSNKRISKPIKLGKSALSAVNRLAQTASIAGLSALRVAKGEKPDAHLLKETFEKLGVTYIKLGQFIASTPSLFPKEYVLAFQDCLDQTTPTSFYIIKSILQEELAHLGKLDEIFHHIDPRPLASASIAQVHKATLNTGETVAIKIQKPNVHTIMQTDLNVLHGLFWTLEKTMPAFQMANLVPIIEEIKKRMLAETNFLAESQHIQNFHRFLSQSGQQKVTAPTVFEHLSTKKVLVMSFFEGVSLIDDNLHQNTHDTPKEIMTTVLDTWLLSLLMTGEFHADLHAGNLMLLKNGQIGFLDFGLMGNIDPKSLQACFTLVEAMGRNDFLAVANAMVDIGMTHERQKINLNDFAHDLQRLLQPNFKKDNTNTQQANHKHTEALHTMMIDLTNISKRHGIHFPRDFALLLKQLLYFDRFMASLAPDMDLFGGQRMTLIKKINQIDEN